MINTEVNYRTLNDGSIYTHTDENADVDTATDNEDTPRNSGVMIHIVPETNKARWTHIEDLDSFFTRMYNYHQKHGFTVIALDEIFQLFEYSFVVWLLTFSVHCIKYSVLFGNEPPGGTYGNYTKVTLGDVITPMGQCVHNFGELTYFVLTLAGLYLIVRFFISICIIKQYSEMKGFYNTALHIPDNELDNITWHEVKCKIREVQTEQHMCIDKEQLTELDIYHRILRFKNYMVALMNKNLLPTRFSIPFFGEVVSLSRGLLINIEFILFRCPGSPFQNNWQLRDDYTVRSNQVELAQRLSKWILYVAIANLLLSPVIFVWQLIYFTFSYANILRKEPGALGMRTWSNYGRLYLRHFNELDHELDARLSRAYEHADKYLSSFSSPLMTVVAKNILFISGGILVLLLALGIYDEYVFQVEHVLAIITVLTVIGLICRTLIPDENLIWCPEQLITAILAHVHYLPTNWKYQAHTAIVRKEFGNFFQFKAGYLLNEICSPFITPFVLIFVFKPKALDIVKFFRSFTVTVRGVGNVCSFAQMDVRKHGNPEWQLQCSAADIPECDDKNNYPVENGKTELSLVRFTLTNPEWQMPPAALNFITSLRENAIQDLKKNDAVSSHELSNPMTESLLSFGTIGNEYQSIATSVLAMHNKNDDIIARSMSQNNKASKPTFSHEIGHPAESDFDQRLLQNLGDPAQGTGSAVGMPNVFHNMATSVGSSENMRKMRVSKVEGRLDGPSGALLYSIYGTSPNIVKNQTDVTVADMCLSTLYLHELHRRNKKTKGSLAGTSKQVHSVVTSTAAESTPLLGNRRS